MKTDETANNADANTEGVYNAGTTYQKGATVRKGDYIYYGLDVDNVGNDPDDSPFFWQKINGLNKHNIYDVYPDTFTIKTNGTLILKYNVTDVDTIFIGNAHGAVVTVNAGGGTFTKPIADGSISPLAVWGIGGYQEVTDFYIEVGQFSGVITITITKAPSDNIAGIGFLNYGLRKSAGCTLLKGIKYRVVTGVKMAWSEGSVAKVRRNSYQEMTLNMKIMDAKETENVISLLAKYRGVPMLIIGDDLGIRKETIFHGVYTDIEADLHEWNKYSLTLRSLQYSSFIPPTIVEQSVIDSENARAGESNTPAIHAQAGVPTCADFGTSTYVIYDSTSVNDRYYCDGTNTHLLGNSVDAFNVQPVIGDFTDGFGRSVIFDGCRQYINNGGVVQQCVPKIDYSNGVPSLADFNANTGKDIIFSGCDMYRIVGGVVTKCENPALVTSSVGVPALAMFTTGQAHFVFDVTSPCDLYYNLAGVVTMCGGGAVASGGSRGVYRFEAENAFLITVKVESNYSERKALDNAPLNNGKVQFDVDGDFKVRTQDTAGIRTTQLLTGCTAFTWYNLTATDMDEINVYPTLAWA